MSHKKKEKKEKIKAEKIFSTFIDTAVFLIPQFP